MNQTLSNEKTSEQPKAEADSTATTCSLFRVIVLHGAPKDSHTATETYLVAESEEEVFRWIDKKNYGAWTEEYDDEPNMRYADDDYEKEIPFREWIMQKRGDLEDEEGWEDAYYGVTKWGWEPVEASQCDIAVLLRLGVAISANDPVEGREGETPESNNQA